MRAFGKPSRVCTLSFFKPGQKEKRNGGVMVTLSLSQLSRRWLESNLLIPLLHKIQSPEHGS